MSLLGPTVIIFNSPQRRYFLDIKNSVLDLDVHVHPKHPHSWQMRRRVAFKYVYIKSALFFST